MQKYHEHISAKLNRGSLIIKASSLKTIKIFLQYFVSYHWCKNLRKSYLIWKNFTYGISYSSEKYIPAFQKSNQKIQLLDNTIFFLKTLNWKYKYPPEYFLIHVPCDIKLNQINPWNWYYNKHIKVSNCRRFGQICVRFLFTHHWNNIFIRIAENFVYSWLKIWIPCNFIERTLIWLKKDWIWKRERYLLNIQLFC